MTAELISIIPVSLKSQKPTKVFDGWLEISDTYIEYKIHFLATEPTNEDDLSLGYKDDVMTYFNVIALKKNVAGIELSLTASGKRWVVVVQVLGFANDIKIYYVHKNLATDLYIKLKNWLLDTPIHIY